MRAKLIVSRRQMAPCGFSPYGDCRKRTSPPGSLYHISGVLKKKDLRVIHNREE